MTIEQVIKKAIDGGFENYPSDAFLNEHWICMHDTACQIFLDPSFWRSLGKAMGWAETYAPIQIVKGTNGELLQSWLSNWHRFIDHLADGKRAEEFFEKLDQKDN